MKVKPIADSFKALIAAIEANDEHAIEREAAKVARERIRKPKRIIKCRTQ
jgi:hypothetical protein